MPATLETSRDLIALDRRASEAAALLTRLVIEHAPVAFASSFSAEDMVVLDLIADRRLSIEVFTLDTGRLPQETHALIDTVRERYRLPITILHPDPEWLGWFTRREGSNAFYR